MNRTNRRKTDSKPVSRWQRVRLMLETLERRDLLALSVLTTADPSWWGATGNAPSGGPSISGDGTLIAFESYAGNLAANSIIAPTGTLGQARQIYVRDALNGQTSMISFDPTGNPLDASQPVMSNDGRSVAFLSNGQIYVRHLDTNTTTLVTSTPGGFPASGSAIYPSISADGRFVGFHGSFSDILAADTNHDGDGYVKDLQSGTLHWLTPHPDRGFSTTVLSGPPVFTSDGRFAYYITNLNLVANDTNNSNDVYRYDLQTQAISLITVAANGTAAGIVAGSVSSDGRYVVFKSSTANVVNGLTGTRTYLRDTTQNTTTQLEVTPGSGDNGSIDQFQFSADNHYLVVQYDPSSFFPPPGTPNRGVYRIDLLNGASTPVTVLSNNTQVDDNATLLGVSSDGRYVSYMSSVNGYVAGDSNGFSDIFLRDMQNGVTQLASHGPGGAVGNGNTTPSFPSLSLSRTYSVSNDGRHIAFTSTASNLTAADNNRVDDVFLYDGTSDGVAIVSSPATGLGTGYTAGGLADFYQYGSRLLSTSPDGRFVLLLSNATDLVSTRYSGDSRNQLFLIDRQTGSRELISVGNDGVSYFPRAVDSASVTPDGRYVVFVSNQKVYVRDRQLAGTQQVNVNSQGVAANGSSFGAAAISDDGRYVAFISSATNLDASFPPASIHSDNIYLRDRTAGTTRLISRNLANSGSGDSFSSTVRLSGDGRYLTFQSNATNLANGDTNNATDVFQYDRLTDSLALVSMKLAGNGSGDQSSTLEDVSSDGRFVAFRSSSTNLVSQTVSGSSQLYVRDMTGGTTQLVTLASNGTTSANSGGDTLSLSRNGRYAVFYSYSNNLVAGLTTSGETVYWRDLQTGQTRMVSINVNGTGGSSTGTPSFGINMKPVVSDDGRYVAFAHTGTDLVNGIQANGSNPFNVYVRDVAAGKTRLLSTDQTGNGGAAGTQSNTQPFGLSIVADGSLFFFDHGSSNLVAADVNRASDVYMATTATASGSIRGTVFDDKNRNATQDPGELGLAGITVYVDANNNGSLDNNETSAISQANGSYALLGLEAGLNHLRMNLSASNSQTFPTGNQSQDVTLATSTSNVIGIDFGVAQKLPDLLPYSVFSSSTTSPGRTITVNWSEANQGDAAAPAGWTDAIYLSQDNILDPSDILLGTFRHVSGLSVGQSDNFSMDITVPPASGAYRIIVQTDRKNLITESNRNNNTASANSLTQVNLPHLLMGTQLNDQFTAVNQTLYYQLDVADGDKTVRLAATRGGGGQVGITIQSLNQQPVTGTLRASLSSGSYIVAVTDFGPSGSPLAFSLLASQPGPSIDSAQPSTVGNAGPVTLQIAGIDLLPGTSFFLISPNGDLLGTTRTSFIDTTNSQATFDLQGRAAGNYTLQAILPGGTVLTSPSALMINSSPAVPMSQGVSVKIALPAEARFFSYSTFQVTVKNTTSNDIPSPLLLIRSPSGTLISTEEFTSNAREPDGTTPFTQVYAAHAGASPGVLRPGEEITIPVYFKVLRNPADKFTFEVFAIHADDTLPMNFDNIDPLSRPAGISDAAWAPMWTAMKARLGTTQGDYIQFLSNAANLMPAGLGSNQSIFKLLQFEAARQQAILGHSISGIITSSDPQVKLAGRRLTIYDAASDVTIPGFVLNDGSFFFNNVPNGDYTFRPEGFLLAGNPIVTVQNGQAVTGVSLTATRGIRVSGYITSFDGFALNNALVRLQSGDQTINTRTDSTGAYLYEGIPSGSYRILVSANGYANVTTNPIMIGSNGLVRNIAMNTEAIVSGHVVFNGGTPSNGSLSLVVTPINGPASFIAPVNVLNNQYTITALPACSYNIKVSFPGYNDAFLSSIPVAAGQELVLPDVNLISAASLQGHVATMVPGVGSAGLSVGVYDGNGQFLTAIQTDEQGNFGLNHVIPDTYTLKVVGLQFGVSSSIVVVVAPGDQLTGLSLQVTAGATIRGTVREAGTNNTLSGTGVMAIDSTGRISFATTNDQGLFEITGVPAGNYRVSLIAAAASSNASQNITVAGQDGEVANLSLIREAGIAEIHGTVMDAALLPIPYVGIFAMQNGIPVLAGYADSSGNYELDFDRTGTFDLYAVGEGATFTIQTGIVVTTGSQQTINFTAGASNLALTLHSSGTSDDGIDVYIYQLVGNAQALVDSQSIGLNDTVQLNHLVPGNYLIRAFGPNNLGLSTSIIVQAGGNVQEFTLSSMATIAGTITGPDGSPLSNARVIITGGNSGSQTATTDQDGRYDLGYLVPGIYSITVLAEGFQTNGASNFTITGAASKDFQMTDNLGTTLKGRLLDEQGRGIYGLLVLLQTADGMVVGSVNSGPDGEFIFTTSIGTNLKLQAGGTAGYLSITVTSIVMNQGHATSLGNLTLFSIGRGSTPVLPITQPLQLSRSLSMQGSNSIQDAGSTLHALNFGFGGFGNQQIPTVPGPVSVEIIKKFEAPKFPGQDWITEINKDLAFDGILEEPTFDQLQGLLDSVSQKCKAECQEAIVKVIRNIIQLNQLKKDLERAKHDVIDTIRMFTYAAPAEFLITSGTLAGIAAFVLDFAAIVTGETLALGGLTLNGYTKGASEVVIKTANAVPQFFADLKTIYDQMTAAAAAKDKNGILTALNVLPKLYISAIGLFLGPSKVALAFNEGKSGIEAIDLGLKGFDAFKFFVKLQDLGKVFEFKQTHETGEALDTADKTLKQVILNYKSQVIRARNAMNDLQLCFANCKNDNDDKHPDPKDLDNPDAKKDGKPVGSRDPNEKLGAGGFGTQRFVQPGSLLPYTVYFENAPTLATAPAQEVFIDDQLDNDADWSTFEFGNVGFGDQVIQVPAGLQEYQTRIDYHNTDGSTLQVDVSMKFDRATGKIHWSFRSVDPISGVLPTGTQDGFLPVNDDTGRGEGFVRYTVRAKTGLATGTTIQNKATIIFDENDPISTNIVVNTIDANAPTSGITALPALTTNNTFTVNWSGSDGSGAGIVKYNVYISIDNGPFTLWLKDTTATSANYTGVRGSRYAFYSVATDGVDFVQTKPLAAQASTLISLDTRPQVDHVVFNKGDTQRSKVFYIQVVFNSIVKVDKTTFDFFLNNRRFVISSVSSQTIDGQTWATLQFPSSSVPYLTVPEGQFRLVTKAKGVKNAQSQTMLADRTDSFFRLYGDANGDGQVNATDIAIFNAAFGKKAGQQGYLWYLDWNNDGKINDIDRRVFKTRIGRHV